MEFLSELISFPALGVAVFVFMVFFRDIWGGAPSASDSSTERGVLFVDEDKRDKLFVFDPTDSADICNMYPFDCDSLLDD